MANHRRALGTIFRMWQDTLPSQFSDSLLECALFTQATVCKRNEFIHYDRATVSWFETARQEAIDRALGDWIYFSDTDHCFAPDLLMRLLALRKKYKTRVLSGLYFNKHPGSHVPVANVWTEDAKFTNLLEWDRSKDIMEIGPCGAGCLLVDRSVFKEFSIKLPQEMPFGTIPGLSEDFSFFMRCKRLGIKTHLALQVESHHLGPREVLASVDSARYWPQTHE